MKISSGSSFAGCFPLKKITLKSLFGAIFQENLLWTQFCLRFSIENNHFEIALEITFGTLCQITLKSLWL